uniref:keratin, type I cytoskeletal 9-like n=1 Tax=Erigeron canadensis TaxID=72917 RepID=UPI001CB9CB10|nr:keratin, type I cytoskeletal 9-like [Erigeron canadensis]
MASKRSQNSAPSEYTTARIGLMQVVPANSTAVSHGGGRSSGGNRGSYENKSQVSYYDKQSGSYARETATEKSTAGDFHWKNGTSGNRSEYKQTETLRFGNKGGYTEVYNEQRIRDVTYDNYGDKRVANYGGGAYGGSGSGSYGGGGGSYGGYDYDSDSDY